MALLLAKITECSEISESRDGEAIGLAYDGDDATVAIENPGAENGEIATSGEGLSWLNSARIFAEPSKDRVQLTVSIGDPRGCFVMEVRRLNDGRIVIHLPHPDESLPHMPTAWEHEGTLVVTRAPRVRSQPVIFDMTPPEGQDDDDDDDGNGIVEGDVASEDEP
jgi:hypothetical protein